jgi:hypothetical protein
MTLRQSNVGSSPPAAPHRRFSRSSTAGRAARYRLIRALTVVCSSQVAVFEKLHCKNRPTVHDAGVLRAFTPGDQPAVRQLVLDGMRERWGDAYDPAANPDLDDISASYVTRGAEVVVVDIGGKIVAAGVLRPERDSPSTPTRPSRRTYAWDAPSLARTRALASGLLAAKAASTWRFATGP